MGPRNVRNLRSRHPYLLLVSNARLQTEVLLKLLWAHPRDVLEVLIKAGRASSELARDLFHLQLLVKMISQVANRFRNAPAAPPKTKI